MSRFQNSSLVGILRCLRLSPTQQNRPKNWQHNLTKNKYIKDLDNVSPVTLILKNFLEFMQENYPDCSTSSTSMEDIYP